MAASQRNDSFYFLGDLTDYCFDNGYNTSLSISILIKAGRISFNNATRLLQYSHNHKFNDEEKLKSAIMKLIYRKKLYRNFSKDSYYCQTLFNATLNEFGIDLDNYGQYTSDNDLIFGLIDEYDCSKEFSGKEMGIIEHIKEEFLEIANVDVYNRFALDYTTDHIRYLTHRKFNKLSKDHIVELQMINKICHISKYDVTEAAAFAWHFNGGFNTTVMDVSVNQQKGEAVKQFLAKGTPSVFIEEIKDLYWKYIRKKVVNSIADEEEDFSEAMAQLDGLLAADVSRRSGPPPLAPNHRYK